MSLTKLDAVHFPREIEPGIGDYRAVAGVPLRRTPYCDKQYNDNRGNDTRHNVSDLQRIEPAFLSKSLRRDNRHGCCSPAQVIVLHPMLRLCKRSARSSPSSP